MAFLKHGVVVGGREKEETCALFGEVREMDGPLVVVLLWVGEGSE